MLEDSKSTIMGKVEKPLASWNLKEICCVLLSIRVGIASPRGLGH